MYNTYTQALQYIYNTHFHYIFMTWVQRTRTSLHHNAKYTELYYM